MYLNERSRPKKRRFTFWRNIRWIVSDDYNRVILNDDYTEGTATDYVNASYITVIILPQLQRISSWCSLILLICIFLPYSTVLAPFLLSFILYPWLILFLTITALPPVQYTVWVLYSENYKLEYFFACLYKFILVSFYINITWTHIYIYNVANYDCYKLF